MCALVNVRRERRLEQADRATDWVGRHEPNRTHARPVDGHVGVEQVGAIVDARLAQEMELALEEGRLVLNALAHRDGLGASRRRRQVNGRRRGQRQRLEVEKVRCVATAARGAAARRWLRLSTLLLLLQPPRQGLVGRLARGWRAVLLVLMARRSAAAAATTTTTTSSSSSSSSSGVVLVMSRPLADRTHLAAASTHLVGKRADTTRPCLWCATTAAATSALAIATFAAATSSSATLAASPAAASIALAGVVVSVASLTTTLASAATATAVGRRRLRLRRSGWCLGRLCHEY